MTFTLFLISFWIAMAALLITARSPESKSVSQCAIAAARYSVASWYEMIAPTAVALRKDPVSQGLLNCERLVANLSVLRTLHPSPQLEFGLLRHAVKAALQHPFLRRAVMASKKRSAAAAGGRGDNGAVIDADAHRLVHTLQTVGSVMQVNCENMRPACAVPVRTRPPRELFVRRLARVRCAVLAFQDEFKLAAMTAGERAAAVGQASALLSLLMLVMALCTIDRLTLHIQRVL